MAVSTTNVLRTDGRSLLAAGLMLRPDIRPGVEEDEKCNVAGCSGIIGYEPVQGCSCHINPPCSACMRNPLVCLSCGRPGDMELRLVDVRRFEYHDVQHGYAHKVVAGKCPSNATQKEVVDFIKSHEWIFGFREFYKHGSNFQVTVYTD